MPIEAFVAAVQVRDMDPTVTDEESLLHGDICPIRDFPLSDSPPVQHSPSNSAGNPTIDPECKVH